MKKLWVSVFVLAALVGLTVLVPGCGEYETTADQKQKEQTEQLMSEINRQVGLPNITNFQQKKLMKMVYELCDKENLICYAYIKSDYHGRLCFIGKCIGFGIPFSAQYTNPEKLVRAYDHGGTTDMSVPQADPNGLFMPTSSSATWLMMIDPDGGEPRPVYIEPEIVVSPFALHKEEK